MAPQGKYFASVEQADSSQLPEREKAFVHHALMFFETYVRLRYALQALLQDLTAWGIDLNRDALPANEEIASDAWKLHRNDVEERLIEIYDTADLLQELAHGAKRHDDGSSIVSQPFFEWADRLCDSIHESLPKELNNTFIGIGKGKAE